MTSLIEAIRNRAVPNIGQFDKATIRALEVAVKRGELSKYRGYWDTMSPVSGIGPLKTIYCK